MQACVQAEAAHRTHSLEWSHKRRHVCLIGSLCTSSCFPHSTSQPAQTLSAVQTRLPPRVLPPPCVSSALLSQCTVGSLRVALVMVTCLWQGPLRGSMGLSRGTRNTKSATSRIECIHGRYIYSSGKTTFLQYVTMMHQQQVPSWHFDKILLPKLGTSAHLNQQR